MSSPRSLALASSSTSVRAASRTRRSPSRCRNWSITTPVCPAAAKSFRAEDRSGSRHLTRACCQSPATADGAEGVAVLRSTYSAQAGIARPGSWGPTPADHQAFGWSVRGVPVVAELSTRSGSHRSRAAAMGMKPPYSGGGLLYRGMATGGWPPHGPASPGRTASGGRQTGAGTQVQATSENRSLALM